MKSRYQWTLRKNTDPYRRQVMQSGTVPGLGLFILLAMRLSCGHTVYRPLAKRSAGSVPEYCRCTVCLRIDQDRKREATRPITPPERCIDEYVGGRRRGAMEAARLALVMEATT